MAILGYSTVALVIILGGVIVAVAGVIFLFATADRSDMTERPTTPLNPVLQAKADQLQSQSRLKEKELRAEMDQLKKHAARYKINAADGLTGPFRVTRVIDGDTIELLLHKKERVRLIGIDAPEDEEYYSSESTKFVKDLLEGQWVNLRFNPLETRDYYKRLLAYVYRADGLFINLEIVKEGYGHAYPYPKYPHPLQKAFIDMENQAKTAGRGLWAK